MNRAERLVRLNCIFQSGRRPSFSELQSELEASPSTIKRDLRDLKLKFRAPVRFDRSEGTYAIENTAGARGQRHQIPGLWLNEQEIHGLVATQFLLTEIAPEILGPQLEPFRAELEKMIGQKQGVESELAKRIAFVPSARRPSQSKHLQTIAMALQQRRRLQVRHWNRASETITNREVSPQRLVYYRDSWYLDCHCHLRNSIRTFALDALQWVTCLDSRAEDLDEADLNHATRSTYGIFSGSDAMWATLRFSPKHARWVKNEKWHAEQKTAVDAQGYLVVHVPYADPTELIMDILRHGADIEVLSPPELRSAVRDELSKAATIYTSNSPDSQNEKESI
jgi:predicted DNA-binding transcriptional regulator YafY